MNRLRKTTYILLSSMLIGLNLPGAASAEASGNTTRLTLQDVQAEAPWALSNISRLEQRGVLNGYEDGSFRPNTAVTRMEVLTAAVRLMGLGKEADSAKSKSAKLKAPDAALFEEAYAWAAGFAAVAEAKRLLPGHNAALQPGQPADRLWTTAVLVRAAGLEREAAKLVDHELDFKDRSSISAEMVGYVSVALDKGIITGYDDNTFRPGNAVSRAELAALLDRARVHMTIRDELAELKGTVRGVAGGQVTLTKDGVSQPFRVSSGARIVRKQRLVDVNELQSGDEVSVLLRDYMLVHATVTKPSAQSPAPAAPPQSPGVDQPGTPGTDGIEGSDIVQSGRFYGSIIHISPERMMIESGGTVASYPPHDQVAIIINGQMAEWDDIHQGDQVTVVITEGRIFHVSGTTIVPLTRLIEGFVSEAYGNHISIASNGRANSYYVPPDAELKRNGATVRVDDLVPGDRITALTENGQIKTILVSLPFQDKDELYIIEGMYSSHRIDQDKNIIEVTIATEIEGNPIQRTLPVDAVNLFTDRPPTLQYGVTKLKLTVINQTVWLFEVIE